MECFKCKVELKLGQAIRSWNDRGCCFTGPHVIGIEELSFQYCGKCPKCGHSDDDVTQWKDEIIELVGYDKWKEEYGAQYDRHCAQQSASKAD